MVQTARWFVWRYSLWLVAPHQSAVGFRVFLRAVWIRKMAALLWMAMAVSADALTAKAPGSTDGL